MNVRGAGVCVWWWWGERVLYVSGREGLEPSQIEGSNLGAVLLQVRGSQLLAKLGELSHAGAVNAAHVAGAHGLSDDLVWFC